MERTIAYAASRTGPVPRPLWPLCTALLLEPVRERAVVRLPDGEALRETAIWLAEWLPDRRIVVVPAWDVAPLDHSFPDPRILARRAVAAEAIAADAWDILLVEATAEVVPLRRHPGPAVRELTIGGELDATELERWGYLRVGEVSAPGEYTVRGELIDFWSPLEEYPLRVERFDVVIEAMRRFDAVSQLGARSVEKYRLGRAGWPPLDAAQTAALVERIRNRAARKHSDPVQLERLLDALHAGVPFVGRAQWLSDHLEIVMLPNRVDVVVSPANVRAAEERLQLLMETERRDLEAEGMPYPHLEQPPPAGPALREVDGPVPDGHGLRVLSLAGEPGRLDAGEQLRRAMTIGAAQGRVWLCCPPGEEAALRRIAAEAGLALDDEVVRVVPLRLRGSWELPDLALKLVDVAQILRRRTARKAAGKLRGLDLGDIRPGEYVVHADYGIGRFVALERIDLDGVPLDVVRLSYRGEDTVLVPVTRLDRLEPYRSGGDDEPELDKLGSGVWQKRRAAAKVELLRFAADLLRLYADREQASRAPLPPPGPLSAAVESSFPWDETPDQLRALEEIEADLAAEHPMDRLLVGDVGFGKTEIALRTVMRFVEHGYQAAVLVPTTVLAAQHGRTFHERLKDLPVRIGVLSRFTGAAEERRILADMRAGRIDIVIGTHRLLQPDIVFQRIGVLVVDEEHRFGVRHKEALKSLRRDLDCLSMSATPIPRTLQMALGGLRPLSIIASPPANRLGVDTQVMVYDDDVVREALIRERARGGQTFVLRNRIDALDETAAHLVRLVPDLRVGIVHGQMRSAEIEEVFLRFMEHRIDVLVATSIIESGLDFPRANTLIVLDAQLYGLAELYQLRGRVGRSDRRAFAYLLHPDPGRLPPKATDRLEVLRSFSALGAGFHVAMRDLEIRGAGEILGKKQAGQLKSVGLSTVMRLLEEAIHELQGQEGAAGVDPEITGDYPLVLSEVWIEDPVERLRAYQQLARLDDIDEAERRIAALVDRFGPPTADDQPILAAARLQPLLRLLHVRQAHFAGEKCTLQLEPSTPLEPVRLLAWIQANHGVRLAPDRLIVSVPPHGPERAAHLASTLQHMVRETMASTAAS